MEERLAAMQGCLLGLAVGDALGYPVRNQSMEQIREHYGPAGLLGYDLLNGYAYVTSYTQIAAYAGNGLLLGLTRGQMRGTMAPYVHYVRLAQQEWAELQGYRGTETGIRCWVSRRGELQFRRCMDNLMLDTLRRGELGTLEEPRNQFKTPGSLPAAVPVGMGLSPKRVNRSELVRLGAEVVALTHGSPMAFLSGGALAYLINRICWDRCKNIRGLVKETVSVMKREFGREYSKAVLELCLRLQSAAALADTYSVSETEALDKIWGDDSSRVLAAAVYVAIRHEKDLDGALIASVNHSGDSAAVGAVTGAIVGALAGSSEFDPFYLDGLEPAKVMKELAQDLYQGCPMAKGSSFFDCEWEGKYIALGN